MSRRPLVLLPPSKGKADDGDGPVYGDVVAADTGPLGEARRRLLAAVVGDLDDLDDAALARVAGVGGAKVAQARALLAGLPGAPTLPAHLRYTGVVHGNAGLADITPRRAGAEVIVVSALAGLAAMGDAVPDYRLEFAATLPSLGGIAGWWREQAADELARRCRGRRVWDLLPAEHARIWTTEARSRVRGLVTVGFVRPDGRAANAARTKVCKGRLTAALLAAPDLDAPGLVTDVDPGDQWVLRLDGDDVLALCHV
ncbi:MAG: peroxide stress protein YaaA [Actinobacteria bacterium]|jgi:hypothetical protein|nr:peroxide stress protein YaaA [Actinomycetota bacterium]